MAIVRLPDGTLHLAEPDMVAGNARLHSLDDAVAAAADPEDLARLVAEHDLALAHTQPSLHRRVYVERKHL